MISVPIVVIVDDATMKPRSEEKIGSARRCASLPDWARSAFPVILSRVDVASAWCGVKSANIGDADMSAQQIVEMRVHRAERIDRNIHILVADHVLRNDRAPNRRTAS